MIPQRDNIIGLAAKYGIFNLRVFGSWARHEQRPDSDLDLLVKVESGRSYFDLIGFWQEVQALLNRKVDVVTDEGLSPFLRERILKEAIPL